MQCHLLIIYSYQVVRLSKSNCIDLLFFTLFSEEEEKRRAKEEPESAGISWGMTDDDVEVSFPGTGCFSV